MDKLTPIKIQLLLFGLIAMPLVYSMQQVSKRCRIDVKTEAAESAEQSTACNPDTMHADIQAVINQHAYQDWFCHEAWLSHVEVNIDTIASCLPLDAQKIALTFNATPDIIKIVDMKSGECIVEFPTQELRSTKPIKLSDTALAFGQVDGTITICDLSTQKTTNFNEKSKAPIQFLIRLSQQFMVSASQTAIIVWDITDMTKPQPTFLREGLSYQLDDSLSRLSDTAFVVVERRPVDGQLSNIMQVWDLFDKKDGATFAPAARPKLDSRIFQDTAVTALNDTTIICKNYPQNFKIIDLATHKAGESTIRNDDEYYSAELFRLSSKIFVSHTPTELSIWDYQDNNKMKRIAHFESDGSYFNFMDTMPFNSYSFACIYQNRLTLYKPQMDCFTTLHKMSFNKRVRLQALIYQLRRLCEERANPTESLQLTTWGKQWLKVMPDVIQERLRSKFNIQTTS